MAPEDTKIKIGEYVVLEDPMDALQCDSCQ